MFYFLPFKRLIEASPQLGRAGEGLFYLFTFLPFYFFTFKCTITG